MKDQKNYWSHKIVDWEKSVYQGRISQHQPFFERLATPFRKLLKRRTDVAVSLVAPHIKGKTVGDLGCGTGMFLERILAFRPKQAVGIDIAPSAISMASVHYKKKIAKKQMAFFCRDVRKDHAILRRLDVIVGIGFIDYFRPDELQDLLIHVHDKYFLFSFPEKILSVRELLQRVYLILASCPGSYKYSKQDMDAMLRHAGVKKWWYYDKENIRFVSNLPC